MSHDLLAELAGYRNELAREERLGRTERARGVRAEVARVRGAIAERADILEAEAADHVEAGQDAKAAQASVQARSLRRALADADKGEQPPAAENAADSKPRRSAAQRTGKV